MNSMFSRYRFCKRWQFEEERILSILEAIKNGNDWTTFIVEDDSHGYGTLPHALDKKIPILDGEKGPRDLRGISLSYIDFSHCDGLHDTHFEYAELKDIDFTKANLTGSYFNCSKIYCSIIDSVSFAGANLTHTNFSKATINGADFSKATLKNNNLKRAKFRAVSFYKTAIRNVKITQRSIFTKGTVVEDVLLGEDGSQIYDENFYFFLKRAQKIDRRRSDRRLSILLFNAVTDYGESYLRLFAFMIVIIIVFGFLYANYPIFDSFQSWDNNLRFPDSLLPETNLIAFKNPSWVDPYYFSVVTFTSLGYGDAFPINVSGRICCMIESLLGVLMMGVFITMLYDNINGNR